MNKDFLKYCPNYYNIVNFEYKDNDFISDKLIKIYKNYIFNANMKSNEDISLIQKLDSVLASYINDFLFRSTLQKEIINVKVKKDSNVIKSLVENIIKIFIDYEEYTTRRIYISKWI